MSRSRPSTAALVGLGLVATVTLTANLSRARAQSPTVEPQAAPPEQEAEAGADVYTTTVTQDYEGPLAQRRATQDSSPGLTSTIEVEEHNEPLAGLPDLLRKAPGVSVRSIGGLGQFSSVSLRGASPLQTPIYIDGVPIDGSTGGLTDLSQQNLSGIDRIEIYRGHVPARFGSAGFGGAINLATRSDVSAARVRTSFAFGSFMTRQARLQYATPLRTRSLDSHAFSMAAAYAGSQGDFPYFDNGGTPTLLDDDQTRDRENNHYDRAHLHWALAGRKGAWSFSHRYTGDFDRRGIPGTGNQAASGAHSTQAHARVIARVEREKFGRRGEQLEFRVSPALHHRSYVDREGGVGIARNDQAALELDGFARAHQRMRAWPSAFFDSGIDLRGQRLEVDEREVSDADMILASGDALRRRASFGADVQLEQHFIDERWRFVAQLRFDATRSAFAVPEGEGEGYDEGRDESHRSWSPRVATRLRVAPHLDLHASFGKHTRQPTMMELFGDRGYIVGNEALRPESGLRSDVGLTFSHAWPRIADVDASVAGFYRQTTDLIHWGRSGVVVRPENVAGARIRGIESHLALRLLGDDIELDARHTLLDSFNESPRSQEHGMALPGLPLHDLWLRAGIGHEFRLRSIPLQLAGGYSYTFISGNFLDPSGRYELPPRNLHGLDFEVAFMRRFSLHFRVHNLGDLRSAEISPERGPRVTYPVAVSDYIGYPLPGRSFWLNLGVDFWPRTPGR